MKKKNRTISAVALALSVVCACSACSSGGIISDSQAESIANGIVDSIDWGGLTGGSETTAAASAPVDPKTVDYSKIDITIAYGDSSTISEIGSNMYYGNYDGRVIKVDGLSCKYGSKYSIMEYDSDSSKTGFDYELIDSTDYPADGVRVELTGVIAPTGDEWGSRRFYVLPSNVKVIGDDAGSEEIPNPTPETDETAVAEGTAEALQIAPDNEDAWEVTKADDQPIATTAETTAADTTAAEAAAITPAPAKEPEIKTDTNGNKYVDVVFDKLPTTYEEFIALPQANLSTVYDTAAMTVLALSYYPTDPDMSIKMYEFVSGPRTINNTEYSFIKDRFMDYDYVPRSYFTGATPQNNYTPDEPYTIRVSENPYTYENENYAKMFMRSGGADSERSVMLRKAKDGKWYLWEQFILVSIRDPEGDNPWA